MLAFIKLNSLLLIKFTYFYLHPSVFQFSIRRNNLFILFTLFTPEGTASIANNARKRRTGQQINASAPTVKRVARV